MFYYVNIACYHLGKGAIVHDRVTINSLIKEENG